MTRFIHLVQRAVRARSADEDRARREFILHVLLLGALALLLIGILDDTFHIALSDPTVHQADSLSMLALCGLFAGFALLYTLSIRGYAIFASFIMLAALFDLAAYMGYRWGVDLSASLLFYAVVITMAGILIHARFAFVAALLAGISIGITLHFHRIGAIHPDRSWITELWKADDVLVATILFLVIALAMWLSNREIEKSLTRARRSEADLKKERDMLEVRVEERTRELRQAELERMTQAYRFVEFGRLASATFHDLMNPLAGLSLNIDRIAASTPRTALADDIGRAKLAADHMQGLLSSMRAHLKRESKEEWFWVHETVQEATRLMATHARERTVELRVIREKTARLYGNPLSLTQALINLLGNAVQAYPPVSPSSAPRPIEVSVSQKNDSLRIMVSDHAGGIAAESLPHIFEPYFTTKGKEGIGLGLSMVKKIIEKDFGGTISVESADAGTTFTLYLPIREP